MLIESTWGRGALVFGRRIGPIVPESVGQGQSMKDRYSRSRDGLGEAAQSTTPDALEHGRGDRLKAEFKKALALRSETRRAGWFN